jgi:hypothetical protein
VSRASVSGLTSWQVVAVDGGFFGTLIELSNARHAVSSVIQCRRFFIGVE